MAAQIGTISYAAAAAAFLFLFLLLVTSWRGRLPGALLGVACLASALWAGAAAYRPAPATQPADALEILRNAAWFAFLVVLLGYSRHGRDAAARRLRLAGAALAALCLLLLAASLSSALGGRMDFMAAALGRTVAAVAGMVLVEQLYRNAHPDQRWGIKFLCLGLGGMFAFDFYLYSDATLFRRVNGDIWDARGIINALVVPLLAVAAARNPKWSLDIFVSRRMVFHSAALLGSGVYLLLMAAAGYYIRYFGGSWGAVLQATFLFGAALLLLAVLFSGSLRARFKVFLNKHFFSYKYDYREEWLRFTRTLSEGEPGKLRERTIAAIAELVESPGGALWLEQEGGAFEKVAHWNLSAASGTEGAQSPFCRFLADSQWVIDVEQCGAQPEKYPALELPPWLRAIPRAWLVVPLIWHDRLLGFVVLAHARSQITMNWEINDILKTAARQAASYLAQLEAAQALLVARQFESFNRMSAFVVHDLKNLVSQLSLLLANAEKHRHNPEFQQDMLSTIEHSVTKMKRLLLQLRSGEPLANKPAPLLLDDLLRQAVAAKSGLKPAPRVEIAAAGLCIFANRERFERVVGHLIQNACEATPPDGRVEARLLRGENSAIIEICDTGRGMSEQFIREKLFKPFESTKSAGMGIGTYESREYVRELGGRLEVASEEGRGSVFRIVMPLFYPNKIVVENALSRRGAG